MKKPICPVSALTKEADDLLKDQIIKVLFGRIILVTIILGLLVFLYSKDDPSFFLPPFIHIGFFISSIYIFTIGSALLIRFVPCSKPFAYLQVIFDIGLTSMLITLSGGSQSILQITYFFPIISAAILLYRRGAFFIASLATFSYAFILLAEYHKVFPALFPEQNIHNIFHFFHRFSVPSLTFFIIALLSSYLVEQLKQTKSALTETTMDRDRLAILYKQIFDDITTGIVTVDANNVITSFNSSASKITGYSSMEAIGIPLMELLPEISKDKESIIRQMTTITRNDGNQIPVGYSWTVLNMPGRNTDHRVYTMQDLSLIKKMEERVQQAEKMATIGNMAAGIAHEFRNPLAAMSGAAQVLQNDFSADPTNQALMNIIIRESDRLEETIREFLLFSKPAHLVKTWFSLLRLAKEGLEIAKNDPDWQPVTIDWQIPETFDCFGDQNQIRQIIINLLTNSVQTTTPSTHLQISGKEHKINEKDYIQLTIADNGPGIAPDKKEKIFEPFFTTRSNGTGLGLSVVQQIIESHEGKITIEDQKPNGTKFKINFPVP